MNSNLKKVVIITGGTAGLGLDIAIKYLDNNWIVIAAARNKRNFLPKNIDFNYIKTDVCSAKDHINLAKKVISLYGRIDCYINCAGISKWSPIGKVSQNFWNKIINTNLMGTFWGCKTASHYLKKNGSIINISSLAGKRGSSNNSVYCASKFGVNGITQSLAKELGSKKIRVNAVCPVYIMTEGLQKALKDKYSPTKGKNIKKYIQSFTHLNSALGNLPQSNDVAEICLFLSSEKSMSITGQCINVDCGILPQ